MKRWHQDKKIAVREWRKHRRTHVESNKMRSFLRVGVSAEVVDCPCDEQVGRFRKMDAFDCGRPRCFVCHGYKYYGKDDWRYAVEDLRFKEQLHAEPG